MPQRLWAAIFPVLAVIGFSAAHAAEHTLHSFEKITLSELFFGEGANAGDFNKDGKVDVVSGPYWYEGPEFKTKHEIYPPKPYDKKGYSDNFFCFTHDFNADGWTDVLVYGFPGIGKDKSGTDGGAVLFLNPAGKAGHWAKTKVFDIVDNESPTFQDITGDGKPEMVFTTEGFMGYAEPNWEKPTEKWTFTKISEKGPWQRFTHGLGLGDVNGDGKADLLDAQGWREQPAAGPQSGPWTFNKQPFGPGGAQMYVYDVNGDGRNDVVTSLQAHGWGLAWFEQNADKTFKQHLIMGEKPEQNAHGVKFSQLHAIELADMDGDGVKDIVTGKRHWAHGPTGDPEPQAPAVLYWFKTVRGANGVSFVPHQIDNDSGVGTQVVVADVNGDALPDVIVGNKRGSFVFIHKTKNVTKEEWEAAQPKPYTPPAPAAAAPSAPAAPATK